MKIIMKAIILAAWVWSRLRPITNHKPKTLVEVNGKPMLWYLLDNLEQNWIIDIVICLWYKWDQIISYCKENYPRVGFTFVENEDYLETNNMYSLYLAKDFLDDDIILMNSDLVYESDIIKWLMKTTWTHVAVDKDTYDEESMKITLNEQWNINDISKIILEDEAYWRSIDVYKVDKNDVIILKANLIQIIEQEKDLNQWTEVLLQRLFVTWEISALPYNIWTSKWIEIDNYDDLYIWEALFNRNYDLLKKIKIVLLDKDWTTTLWNSILPYVNEFITLLNNKKIDYLLMSNNSSKTPADTLERFSNLWVKWFDKENILLSSDLAIDYLKRSGLDRIAILASDTVVKYFNEQWISIDFDDPEAVLLTYDNEITFDKICIIHNLIQQWIPYYATHPDIVCPLEHWNMPDIWSYIELFKASTWKLPSIIFGKPEKYAIDYIRNNFWVKEEEILMIWDRIYTDIELWKDTNIVTVLVLTWEWKRWDVEFNKTKPHFIVDNLSTLSKFL